jgi:lipopolysaccharide/colanic/teichoic acid biosynthesis glycosyltransferase
MHATNMHVTAVDMTVSGNGRRSRKSAGATAAALPAVQLQSRPHTFGVRLLNVAAASLAAIVVAPFVLVIALAVKLTSPGPIFYTQDRIGLDRRDGRARARPAGQRARDLGGRPFRIYKFRTMHVGAEHKTGPVWATPGDSRVTWPGRLMRRTRIDELPQLWNVIRGEMNIVGPRPERPTLVAYLNQEIDDYALRHRVPPGITGWAQVNQSYDTTLESVRCKLMFDLDYIHRRSVLFDMRIMFSTIPAILRKRGGW